MTSEEFIDFVLLGIVAVLVFLFLYSTAAYW